jgi:hypothetical protein
MEKIPAEITIKFLRSTRTQRVHVPSNSQVSTSLDRVVKAGNLDLMMLLDRCGLQRRDSLHSRLAMTIWIRYDRFRRISAKIAQQQPNPCAKSNREHRSEANAMPKL